MILHGISEEGALLCIITHQVKEDFDFIDKSFALIHDAPGYPGGVFRSATHLAFEFPALFASQPFIVLLHASRKIQKGGGLDAFLTNLPTHRFGRFTHDREDWRILKQVIQDQSIYPLTKGNLPQH